MKNVYRLVNLVYGTDTYMFNVNVFTKQDEYASNTVFCSPLRVFNM